MNAHQVLRPVTLVLLPLLLAACERQPVATIPQATAGNVGGEGGGLGPTALAAR